MNREQNTKIVYDTIDFNIAIGQNAFLASKDLRDGRCIGVKVIEFSKVNRPDPVNVSIQSSDSTELVGRTDYRDYDAANGGGYVASFKPCGFDTKAQIRLSINTLTNIAGTAFSGQAIFMIEQTSNS